MVMQTERALTTRHQTGPCACGCAPCDDVSCGLDCVIQPRYFCGQLLTDADLAAGVTWSQNKFRLSRRREGWGVVCGLEVTCGPRPGWVTVQPGYAVNCCGDDIVVCSPAELDLGALLRQPPGPCEPEQRRSQVEVSRRAEPGEWVVMDLWIDYREEQIIPATTLGRAACGQSGECEYSRIKETHRLTGELIERGMELNLRSPDVYIIAYERWEQGFKKWTSSLFNDLGESSDDLGRVQRVLRRWQESHPIYQFCFLNDFYSSSDLERWVEQYEMRVPEIMFLAMQDYLNRFLALGCAACEEPKVRLARVWLKTVVSQGNVQYVENQINMLPPYRREHQPDRLPAPLGFVNLGEVIWRDLRDAAAILARQGIRLNPPSAVPVDLDNISRVIDLFDPGRYLLEVGRSYVPIYYDDKVGLRHLVGVAEGHV